MTQWIDTHVHLFTNDTAGEKPVQLKGKLNTVSLYQQALKQQLPTGVVVVDFSMAQNSEHVMATLPLLQEHGIPARGIIRGDVEEPRSFEWIKHPQIAGIRLYAIKEVPDLSQNKAKWDRLFTLLRHYGKQICLFGTPQKLRQLIAQLPNDLPLLIDHLGMPNAQEGINQHHYAQLLADLSSRFKTGQPVYFKGPGYRTSYEPKKTVPYLLKTIELFGEKQLILGASDAPFAGPVIEKNGYFSGKQNQDVMGYDRILPYLNSLVELAAQRSNKSFEMLQMQLLYSNAQRLYQFEEASTAKAA